MARPRFTTDAFHDLEEIVRYIRGFRGARFSPIPAAALAFFYDHQAEFEQEMLNRERDVALWKAELGESQLQRRLRHLKASQ